ncbi:MAG: imidazole glycerol phosphate synthase subunit HisH [Alistipes sp.]|nr:imidazole glycerol phosphate synthase subunit HisH [Alistipes sp.]
MVVVIDYDTGNLRSVENALRRLGVEYRLSSDEAEIRGAERVILPGVGEARSAMERLRASGVDRVLPGLRVPVLGICIGMQLMCRWSEEGDTGCLGIFPADVVRIPAMDGIKVPHMGWDSVGHNGEGLFAGLEDGAYFYYVHSYAPQVCDKTVATTDYGIKFSAALRSGNFYGTQFHPEKSGSVGEKMLANFLAL